jgi:hypothetical protein
MPFLRKYNTLTVTGTTSIRIPIIKRGVVDFAVSADWTPAAGDVKIAIDGAAPANVTNLPVATASGNGAWWEFILTAAELSCKQAIVTVVDAATKAIEDQSFLVETYGNASAMYQADLSAANLPANVIAIAGTTQTARDLGASVLISAGAGTGQLDVTAGVVKSNAIQFGGQTVTATVPVTITGRLANTSNITAGTITTVTNLTNAPTAGDWTAAMKASALVSANNATPAARSVTGAVASVTAVVSADVTKLNGNANAAATFAILNGSTVVYRGTVTGATTTTTLIDTALTQADVDWWKGRIIIFTSGITLQATDITAFDTGTKTLTFTAVTRAPTAGPGGSTYVII